MKNLLISVFLIFSFLLTGSLRADEKVYFSNIENSAFEAFAIPLPVRLDINGQFNHDIPFIAPENEAAFEGKFYPTFLIASGSNEKIYALSKTETLDSDNTLKMASDEDGYIYIKKSDLSVGFGLNGSMVAGATFSIGLAPYFGKGKIEERIITSKKKKYLKELEELAIPQSKEIFDSWKIGEKLSYYKKGGVQFSASAGYFLVGASIGFTAEGTWKVIMHKISDDKLVAHMRKMKLVSLKSGVSAVVLSTDARKYWKFDDDFSFIFDFRDEKAINTLKDMLKGRMKRVQELARDLDVESVTAMAHENSKTSGHNFRGSFSIPAFFSARFLIGEELEKSTTEYYKDNLRIDIYKGEIARYASTGGAVSRNYTRYNFFDGNVAEIKAIQGEAEKKVITWAHYHYLFQRDKFDKKTLDNEVIKLFRKIGYYEQIKLNAPVEGKFGSVRIQFDTVFSNPGAVRLLNEYKMSTRDDFVTKGSSLIRGYFANDSNAKLVCGRLQKIKMCEKIFIIQTRNYLKRAHKYFSKMKEAWRNQDHSAVAKNFSRFGKNLTKNLFTFEIFKELFGKNNIKMFLSVQGDEIARYQKEIML
ncbi:MAG: hypothetical protein DRQ88_04010 [Epsilonproteobacteria bacterium]|nr:MAG: hypothetical protein DRQ89_04315 [Campylobacterota bacterium]RLA67200.1 MAG: hypothetical protein DRQ88_04010 [Campylobacterota bacterium]